MPIVEMPDGARVRFPDNFSETQIRGLIAHKFPREVAEATIASGRRQQLSPEAMQEPGGYGQSYLAQGASGLNEGIANMLGAPVDLANTAVGMGMKGVNALAGTDFQPSSEPLGGSAGLKRSFQEMGAVRPNTSEPGKQMLRRTGQSVGSSLVPALGAAGGSTSAALGVLGSGAAGGGAAAISQQVAPGNPTAETIAELVASLGTAGATAYLKKHSANKAARGAVPTVEKLKDQASAQYDIAEKNGVTASQQMTQKLASDMRKTAMDEGLISPTGRISEAYPKAREAIRLLDDYAQGDMTVAQMKSVRKTLSDAAKSADGSEGRIASMMLKQFDDFTAPLAPPLSKARALYTAAMKGEKLETVRELAGSRAGQFTGSGYENALRTEYRGLERNIIKGNERGFSDAEQKAISKVAQGTPASNTFRNIGRLAPTGPVSAMATAGIPFMIGDAIAGPYAGMGAALGAGTVGYGARSAATKMGMNAAQDAELLARNSGAIPRGLLDEEFIRRLLAGVGASNVANSAGGN